MAIYSEETVFDQINAKESGHVECRQATRVLKDGVVISTTYHRHVVSVADDLTLQDPKIQAVCAANWSPELSLAKTAAIVAESVIHAANQAACDLVCAAAEAAKVKADLATEAAKTALEAQLAAEKALADAAEAARVKAEFDAAVAAAVADAQPKEVTP